MSPKLNISPFEIPELLHLIGCHLSTIELKTCMLVSKTWHTIFEAYLWHNLEYNSQGIPHLGQRGHLVRHLNTYKLSAKDLYIVAGSCHLVQQLKLDLGDFFNQLAPGLETIVANMPHITDLTLWLPLSMHQMYFCAISRLKHLRYLTLSSSYKRYHPACDLKLLLNVIQKCPQIFSLRMENITFVDPSTREQPLSQPSEYSVDLFVYPPGYRSWWDRAWFRHLQNKVQPKEEPWRKFGKVTQAENQTRPSYQDLLGEPDASMVYPQLTRLDIKNVIFGTLHDPSLPCVLLFKKAPYLKELYVDFTRFAPTLPSTCLDVITENCLELSTLTLDGLRATVDNQQSINRFFKRNRPGLERLTLKRCVNFEKALDLIPNDTAHGLQHLRLEATVTSHWVLHRFLQRCSSLQSLAWTMTSTESRLPDPTMRFSSLPDPTMRFSAFLEPWPCYQTLRHVEFGITDMDKDSFDAYFRRLTLMDRLVSMSIPMSDLRRSIVKRGREMKGWYFPSVLELTITAGSTRPLCSLDELCYTLKAFPKLRKIRYEGSQYPLDDTAYHYLTSQLERPVMVVHTTQIPAFIK
ncbi:hypothetical protein EC968_007362 [Mortierella alpina]|nr:hypothetical protein EC968_007362 [Mortierella alpina]